MAKIDLLKPDPAILLALASCAVHVIEARSPGGHPFDVEAAASAVVTPQVRAYLFLLVGAGMAPMPRDKSILSEPAR